ncbi:protein yellow isoform X1 [Papilio machaon]|uniref:protein yellow isoform X1 n=2 Tax=Papilio machaon TaxID=76193 RepID=UPI001E6643C2|nr:protein yellow isoform X1 [Papilio machaon]
MLPATVEQYRVCSDLLSRYDPLTLQAHKWEMGLGIERFFLLSYCIACCWQGLHAQNQFRVVRQWAELDFVYPSEEAKQRAARENYYVRGNSVPIDVEVHHRKGSQKSRIFVSIPRFDAGRPVTFGIVEDDGRIRGYPDYSWHDNQGYNCDGMTSVFRVAIDECDRLWIMDTGKIGEEQRCPPQILAFNLSTDELIYRHKVANTSYTTESLFITPVVDVRKKGDSCADTFVYVADVSGFGFLVLDVANDRTWRIKHRLAYPFPSRGTFTIQNESFELMDGVLGMALSPLRPDGERYLYFHALASTTENVVSTSLLRNDSFIKNINAPANSMNPFPEERPNQAAAQAMDRNGILYFGLMDPPSVWCWNSATEFSTRNFHPVAINKETLQFASGVKVVNNLKGQQELWVMTCRFQKVMTETLNSNEVNFRINAEKIPILLKNSPCAIPPKDQRHGYHANMITPKEESYITYRYGAYL